MKAGRPFDSTPAPHRVRSLMRARPRASLRRWLRDVNLGHYTTGRETVPFVNERPFSHTYLIGKKDVGKTVALINYVLEDIEEARQAVFIDLNGAATEAILNRVPAHRAEAITLLEFGTEHAPVMNLFYDIPQERHAKIAGMLVKLVSAIWDYGGSPTPRLDVNLRAGSRVVLSQRNGTLLDLYYLMTDERSRKRYLAREKDKIVKDMWERFSDKEEREQNANIESALTRVFEIVSDPLVRGIVGQYRTSFDLNDTTVLLASIPESVFGRDIARLLGCILLAQVQLSGEPFRVHLDDADRFVPAQLIEMLDSPVALTIANRYLDQLDEKLRAAILGTAGTLICFQIGPEDVESIQPLLEFRSQAARGFNQNSVYYLTETPPYSAYARTDRVQLIEMPGLSPETSPKVAEAIRKRCRSQYGRRNDSTSMS